MQENFNHTKERILQYLKYKSISIRKFSEKVSISPSNFNEKNMISALSGDILSRILTEFPDINPDWLLLNRGEMLRRSEPAAPPDGTITLLLEQIKDLARDVGRLQTENDELKNKLARAESKMAAYAAAAAG